jgi:tellurite resistance protein
LEMPQPDVSLIGKVARQLSRSPSYAAEGTKGSLLAASAASYGWRKEDEEVTQPTGFDPEAARLFEAVVEGAYLVANADGDFDAAEQSAFQHVVVTACGGRVAERQVSALLSDLHDQLHEDGIDKRVQMVARSISREDHAREVLRIAALLAHVSGGVSEQEEGVLSRLAAELRLGKDDIARALSEAAQALED